MEKEKEKEKESSLVSFSNTIPKTQFTPLKTYGLEHEKDKNKKVVKEYINEFFSETWMRDYFF